MGTPKRERIEARITPEQKALFQRAADLQGRSLTDFALSSMLRQAEEVIRAHEVLTLNAADSLLFVEALLNPPAPDAALQRAVERSRERLPD